MKYKCYDGVTREFSPAYNEGDKRRDGTRADFSSESRCLECGETFGVHDTAFVKQYWKYHKCELKAGSR
jgi:hypothetical protein